MVALFHSFNHMECTDWWNDVFKATLNNLIFLFARELLILIILG